MKNSTLEKLYAIKYKNNASIIHSFQCKYLNKSFFAAVNSNESLHFIISLTVAICGFSWKQKLNAIRTI